MNDKRFKIFAALLVTLLLVFGIYYFTKADTAILTLKDEGLDVEAYSLVEKELFMDLVDENESDYDELHIYLTNDDHDEFNIETDLESMYESFDLELKDKNLIPVGQKITIRYKINQGKETADQLIGKTLDYTVDITILDGNDQPIQERYVLSSANTIDEDLDFHGYLIKFDDQLDEIPLTIHHSIKENENGTFPLTIENSDYDFKKEIEVVIQSDEDQSANLDQLDVLVNKQYHLTEHDVPPLTSVPDNYALEPGMQVQPVALEHFIELVEAMKEETDMVVIVNSGYRSYNYQVGLFNTFANREGVEAASKFSARAGQSEHQTGLAIDVTKPGVFMDNFGSTKESVWVADNAHRFGFIIRFPEGKDDITGYQYEPWHLRYLGKDLALKVKDSGLTFDEYWIQHLQ